MLDEMRDANDEKLREVRPTRASAAAFLCTQHQSHIHWKCSSCSETRTFVVSKDLLRMHARPVCHFSPPPPQLKGEQFSDFSKVEAGLPPLGQTLDRSVVVRFARCDRDCSVQFLTFQYLQRRVTRTQHPVERRIKYFNRMCLHDYARLKDGGKRLVRRTRSFKIGMRVPLHCTRSESPHEVAPGCIGKRWPQPSFLRTSPVRTRWDEALLCLFHQVELMRQMGGWFVFEPHDWTDSWTLQDALFNAHVLYDVPVLFQFNVWPDAEQIVSNTIVVRGALAHTETKNRK